MATARDCVIPCSSCFSDMRNWTGQFAPPRCQKVRAAHLSCTECRGQEETCENVPEGTEDVARDLARAFRGATEWTPAIKVAQEIAEDELVVALDVESSFTSGVVKDLGDYDDSEESEDNDSNEADAGSEEAVYQTSQAIVPQRRTVVTTEASQFQHALVTERQAVALESIVTQSIAGRVFHERQIAAAERLATAAEQMAASAEQQAADLAAIREANEHIPKEWK
ncbi:hypothetical protein F4861DRAFT_547168 [Xylaria intraflava]|nr:hypothetical protein F4861DRAFT_547168 [Xylaria intraflava]